MTWNDAATPAGWVLVSTARHGNVFLETDTLTLTLSASTAVSYEVRDYDGQIVDSGAVSGTSLTIDPLPLGWYKLYLQQAGTDANYGSHIGSQLFSIVKADARLLAPQAAGVTPGAAPESQNSEHVLRGVSVLGPHRFWIANAADPITGNSAVANISSAQADLVYYQQWYEANPDPVRPRPAFMSFPNGGTATSAHTDGVTATVDALYPGIEYFEGPANEPQGTAAATVAADMQTFYNAVKAGNASAKVLGPNPVSVNGGSGGLPWLSAFLAAGGGQYVDGLSIHVYNCINGDITLGRRSMDAFMALLATHGLQDIELWQSEWGVFAATYGVLEPQRQARWAMMHRFVLEQYGIPKERDYWFYDSSRGFWNYPSFWRTANSGIMPMIAMTRVYSQEVYGKTWDSALDFGTVENDHYIGNRFEDPAAGDAVLALLSGGRTDGTVRLRVTGASSLELVGRFGEVSTIATDARGLASVPVGLEPVYVRLPAGVTATVEQVSYGTNITRWDGGVAVDGTGTNKTRLVNQTLENSYYQATSEPTEFRDDATLPATVVVDLQTSRRFDTVIVQCPTPWQEQGTLTDYDLQYQDANGTWQTLETVTQTHDTFTLRDTLGNGRCLVESYYTARCIFVHTFDPVTARKIRLNVRDATFGGGMSQLAVDAGGQVGTHKIRIREISVYSRDTQRTRVVLAPA